MEIDVTYRIKTCWLKWRTTPGVLCERKVLLKLKEQIYKVVIGHAMMYGFKCWLSKKAHGWKMEIEGMTFKPLRWYGHVIRRLSSSTIRSVESKMIDDKSKK